MSTPYESNTDLSGFAAIINSRLAANARIANAIAFGWICGGVAAMLALSAAGIAVAFNGYSYLTSIRPSAEQTAKAIVRALEKAKINTEITGTVSLAKDSVLKLAPNQRIGFADGTAIKIDPNSSVRVIGEVKMPQPSAYQLQRDQMSGDQLPFTTYTIFRSVTFGAGRVETGWNFDLSDTSRPKSQYCSYVQTLAKGTDVKDVIAVNGVARAPSTKDRLSYDLNSAVASCIWFSGI